MARTLFDCVGDWFENIVQAQFPDLRKIPDKNGTRPDFEGDVFDAEGKVGFWEYGLQLKEAQVKNFKPIDKPLIYIAGYHTAAGLRSVTARMAEEEIDDLLQRNAGLHSAYVVSNRIIGKIWKRENHTAANHPEWKYFSLRPRHLDAIIHNRPFTRRGIRHMPSRQYGLCRPDLLLQPAPLLNGRTTKLEFGVILDKEEDKPAIEYLNERGLIY
ncbi:MAG: hypothetical protein AABX53_00520 [Nanoarchaeota archaeon]